MTSPDDQPLAPNAKPKLKPRLGWGIGIGVTLLLVIVSGASKPATPQTPQTVPLQATLSTQDNNYTAQTKGDSTSSPASSTPAISTTPATSQPVTTPNTPTPAPTPAQPTGCTNGTYVNSGGNTICSPEASPTTPAGATAQCVDGTYSFSQHRSGACSHHGGIAQWL